MAAGEVRNWVIEMACRERMAAENEGPFLGHYVIRWARFQDRKHKFLHKVAYVESTIKSWKTLEEQKIQSEIKIKMKNYRLGGRAS